MRRTALGRPPPSSAQAQAQPRRRARRSSARRRPRVPLVPHRTAPGTAWPCLGNGSDGLERSNDGAACQSPWSKAKAAMIICEAAQHGLGCITHARPLHRGGVLLVPRHMCVACCSNLVWSLLSYASAVLFSAGPVSAVSHNLWRDKGSPQSWICHARTSQSLSVYPDPVPKAFILMSVLASSTTSSWSWKGRDVLSSSAFELVCLGTLS
jgi:hypothetical protein